MKRFVSLILGFMLVTFCIAQNPCNLFTQPIPNQASINIGRIDVTVNKVSSSQQSPKINGRIDNVWLFADEVNITKHNPYSTFDYTPNPDLGINGSARFLYDNEWLYIIVVVSGDETLDSTGNALEQDNLQLTFQNTWHGKGTAATHCNDDNWRNWYWEQDGDRKWNMPVNPYTKLTWLDQAISDTCGDTTCAEIAGSEWHTYDTTNTIKYAVYTSSIADTIIYEMALHLTNWLKYDSAKITSGLEDHNFGFDISIQDLDDNIKNDQLNISDPGNNTWAWAPANGKFTFGSEFNDNTVSFTVDDGVDPVPGAEVTFNSQIIPTNYLGVTTFKNVTQNVFLQYIVKATGYEEAQGFIFVNDQEIDTTIHLSEKTYNISFVVYNGDTLIEGAEVTFNSQILLTNRYGIAVFSDIYSNANLTYTVHVKGFVDVTGTIKQINQDKEYTVYITDRIPETTPVLIPNVITPNGDGFNDYFVIDESIINSDIKIFNRAGKVVYQNDNYNNEWNGIDLDGNKLSSGNYWYVITNPSFPNAFTGFVFIK